MASPKQWDRSLVVEKRLGCAGRQPKHRHRILPRQLCVTHASHTPTAQGLARSLSKKISRWKGGWMKGEIFGNEAHDLLGPLERSQMRNKSLCYLQKATCICTEWITDREEQECQRQSPYRNPHTSPAAYNSRYCRPRVAQHRVPPSCTRLLPLCT